MANERHIVGRGKETSEYLGPLVPVRHWTGTLRCLCHLMWQSNSFRFSQSMPVSKYPMDIWMKSSRGGSPLCGPGQTRRFGRNRALLWVF